MWYSITTASACANRKEKSEMKEFKICGITYYVYQATAIAECDEGDESKR